PCTCVPAQPRPAPWAVNLRVLHLRSTRGEPILTHTRLRLGPGPWVGTGNTPVSGRRPRTTNVVGGQGKPVCPDGTHAVSPRMRTAPAAAGAVPVRGACAVALSPPRCAPCVRRRSAPGTHRGRRRRPGATPLRRPRRGR